MPERLSRRTLGDMPEPIRRPRYDLDAFSTGIVHFGPGAFFRAHIASYVDDQMPPVGRLAGKTFRLDGPI